MTPSLPRIVDAFAGLHVVVIGEAILDAYLEGTTGRLCREAPVPIVEVVGRREAPGGAANAAVNARALGARVSLLSAVGGDPEGARLLALLADRGVETAGVTIDPDRRTLAKQRVVAGGQLLVRFDQGSTGPVGSSTERAIIDGLSGRFAGADAVIVSDYGYGILTPRVIAALARLRRDRSGVVVVDAKNLPAYRDLAPTAIKPNYDEAAALLGLEPREGHGARAEAIASRGGAILERTGARIAAVTLDAEGAVVLERDRPPYRTYARPTDHSRASGAGDTFVAALALALAAGAETPAAADIASAASAVVVGREGTVACPALDLRERVDSGDKPVDAASDLRSRLAGYRREGRRIVFTNGCFDILHRGHISYLSLAKSLGDVLVVGVNSDAGIRRLKGPTRPINPLEDRLGVLGALSCVDLIVPFDEETPADLIRIVRPDVFVKGGDYTIERLPEAAIVEELGGVVRILPFLADRSTTDIIERIRRAHAAEPAGGVIG